MHSNINFLRETSSFANNTFEFSVCNLNSSNSSNIFSFVDIDISWHFPIHNYLQQFVVEDPRSPYTTWRAAASHWVLSRALLRASNWTWNNENIIYLNTVIYYYIMILFRNQQWIIWTRTNYTSFSEWINYLNMMNEWIMWL